MCLTACIGASSGDSRNQQFRHRNVANEALFIGIGRGMIARGVAVNQIAGQAGMSEQARCAIFGHQHRSAAVTLPEMRSTADLRIALFCRSDQLGAAAQQRIKQCGRSSAAAIGIVGTAHRLRQGQSIEHQGSLRSVCEIGRGRGESQSYGRRRRQSTREQESDPLRDPAQGVLLHPGVRVLVHPGDPRDVEAVRHRRPRVRGAFLLGVAAHGAGPLSYDRRSNTP